jgi:hypothetical protein
MGEVNIPLYCLDCIHSRYDGDRMVGSYAYGGGPEASYLCKKDRNMIHYWYHSKSCPESDDGEEIY